MYLRMDPALGKVREALGDDVTIVVMSDHGFAPYHREFSLNTWLVDNGYVLPDSVKPIIGPAKPIVIETKPSFAGQISGIVPPRESSSAPTYIFQ